MEFTEFVLHTQREVQGRLGSRYDVDIMRTPKNNGTTLTGMSIEKEGGHLPLTVRLDKYYEYVEDGMAIELVADDIIKTYRDSGEPEISLKDVLDFDRAKDKIVCKLVNTEANREILDDIPHIIWMDLSVIFYLLLEGGNSGQVTTLIYWEHLSEWGIALGELYQLARRNMERLRPVQIKPLSEVLKEIVQRSMGSGFMEELEDGWEEVGSPMYMLTNSVGVAGACCMLPGMGVERLADELGEDLVILPSSIHEVLAIPYNEGMDLECASRVVQGINQTEVPEEDRLSDRVYYFDREKGMLMVGKDGEIQWKSACQEGKEA